jgi:hypothetical protein
LALDGKNPRYGSAIKDGTFPGIEGYLNKLSGQIACAQKNKLKEELCKKIVDKFWPDHLDGIKYQLEIAGLKLDEKGLKSYPLLLNSSEFKSKSIRPVSTTPSHLEEFFHACNKSVGALPEDKSSVSHKAALFNGLRFYDNLVPPSANPLFECKGGKFVRSSAPLDLGKYFDASMDPNINCSSAGCQPKPEDCVCMQKHFADQQVKYKLVEPVLNPSCDKVKIKAKSCSNGYFAVPESSPTSGSSKKSSQPTSGRK